MLKTLYYSLIHTHFYYGCLLWGNTRRISLRKLEGLQKKAIRIVSRTSQNTPTAPLFKDLSIPTINEMFKMQVGHCMYLAYHNCLPIISLSEYFTKTSMVHRYHTRQSNSFQLPIVHSDLFHRSFIFQGPKLWLQIPFVVRNSVSSKSFVTKFKRHLLCK